MTEPKNPTVTEPGEPLPGFDFVAPSRLSPLENAAGRTLRALKDADLVDEKHALPMQLIVELAAVVATACRKGQASAAAMASAQILAALELLNPATEGGDPDAYDQLAADLRAAAMGSSRSAAQVRDST